MALPVNSTLSGLAFQERKREEMIILAKRHEVHQQRIHAAGLPGSALAYKRV